jgi:hypothetical protein
MGMEEEGGEHNEQRDVGGGEGGAVVRIYDEYWRREDRSKWMPELGRTHTAFKFSRAWGKEWAVCVGKFLDFESTWGFVEKGVQVGKSYRPQQVTGW